MEKLLPATRFIRVHKSYIIALAQIRTIYGNSIELGKTTIPIGINYKENVMNLVSRRSGNQGFSSN
jgi:DNA-binding LytR/AlgR family response regulator